MPVHDLFSKRQKRLKGDVPDVYSYDEIPKSLRVQVVHIWSRAIGNQYDNKSGAAYANIAKILCEEYGLLRLPGYENTHDLYDELLVFFLGEKDVERVLDVIELSFQFIDKDTRSFDYIRRRNASQIADDAIQELNVRFREHGVGFQFLDGRIVRVDSEYVHSEAIKPAIRLLYKKRYAGAQQEFLSAHQHYRKGGRRKRSTTALRHSKV